MVGVEGLTLNTQESGWLEHPLFGGVVLFKRNCQSPIQIRQLVEAVHQKRPDALVAIDWEGGRVERLPVDMFPHIPPMRSLGHLYDQCPEYAKEKAQLYGHIIGKELSLLGIDLTFAPVLDVDYQVSEVIGDRSFHSDPTIVAVLAECLIGGVHASGVKVVGKHFPGHGGTSSDTHTDTATDCCSKHEIDTGVAPFEHLIKYKRLDGIMMAHVIYSELDSTIATLSNYWVYQTLKKKLGYCGMLFTDDLNMQGIIKIHSDVNELFLECRGLGYDYVLLCEDNKKIDYILSRNMHL